MAVLAIDFDIVCAVADDAGHGFFRVQVAPGLIEVTDLQVGPQFHRSLLRRQFAEKDFQQGTFTDAVVADKTDAVAAHDLETQTLDQ